MMVHATPLLRGSECLTLLYYFLLLIADKEHTHLPYPHILPLCDLGGILLPSHATPYPCCLGVLPCCFPFCFLVQFCLLNSLAVQAFLVLAFKVDSCLM